MQTNAEEMFVGTRNVSKGKFGKRKVLKEDV